MVHLFVNSAASIHANIWDIGNLCGVKGLVSSSRRLKAAPDCEVGVIIGKYLLILELWQYYVNVLISTIRNRK
jgi:hypothetical protein